MKKAVLIFFILICCQVLKIDAQRCLPGQTALEVKAGLVNGYVFQNDKKPAYYIGIAGSSFTRKGSRWNYGFEYLERNYPYKSIAIPVSQITAEGGYYQHVLSNRGKDVLLLLGISGIIGYESVNWNEKLLFDGATIMNKDNFIYGFSPGAILDVYLIDKIVIFMSVRERIMFGSSVTKFHLQTGLGIRFIIN